MVNHTTLLLLESEFTNSQLIAAGFRKNGWGVAVATDGSLARSHSLKLSPDIILLNASVKGGGQAAMAALAASPQTATIPVVVYNIKSLKERAVFLAAGVKACISDKRATPSDPLLNSELAMETCLKVLAGPEKVKQAPVERIQSPARMKALHATGLLDAPPKECFDRLTEMAATLLDAPTALMSLVDVDRQFFMSQYGLKEPWATKRETPLSHSFCQWVVSDSAELMVSNAKEHPVLADNGAVKDLDVAAYAGVPIKAQPKQIIGSFCALDSETREWTDEEQATLRDLVLIVNAFVMMHYIGSFSDSAGSLDVTPDKLVSCASGAINGATRILSRGGARLGKVEREVLLKLIIDWTEELKVFATELAA